MRLDYRTAGSWALMGLVATGCKDDTPPPSEDTTGSTSSDDTTSGTSGTSMVSADSTAGDQGGSSSEGGSSSGEPPPTEVAVRGEIQDFFAMGPIPDAEISVLGQPSLMTVSDAEGLWEVQDVPVDLFDRFIIAPSDNYWGAVVPFTTEFMDLEDVELSQVSLEVIDIQIGALQGQDPMVELIPDTAVLLVAIEQNNATGAIVELEPLPPEAIFYAPDASGAPILGLNEVQWSLFPVMVYFNLPPADEGEYTVTVTHPERECTPDDSQPPTFGQHINLIRVDCPPV